MHKPFIKRACIVCLVLLLCFGAAITVCAASGLPAIMPGPHIRFPFLEWLSGLNIPVISGIAKGIYDFFVFLFGRLVY